MTWTIRAATEADAAPCAAIYARYVTETAITFEIEPPDAAEMAPADRHGRRHARLAGAGGCRGRGRLRVRPALPPTSGVPVGLRDQHLPGPEPTTDRRRSRAVFRPVWTGWRSVATRRAMGGMTMPNDGQCRTPSSARVHPGRGVPGRRLEARGVARRSLGAKARLGRGGPADRAALIGLARTPQGRRGRSYSRGMAWFRRRRAEQVVLRVVCGAACAAGWPASDAVRRNEQHRSLRRIAAEAVIMQDEAEAVIQWIRAREPLGYLAPRGGPLVRRFFALRDTLPRRCDDPNNNELRSILDVTLHHHAVAVATALEYTGVRMALGAQAGAAGGRARRSRCSGPGNSIRCTPRLGPLISSGAGRRSPQCARSSAATALRTCGPRRGRTGRSRPCRPSATFVRVAGASRAPGRCRPANRGGP